MIDSNTKEVLFYHITSDTLEKSLADLSGKLYEKKERTLVVCSSETQMRDINNMLWSFSTKKFIPHGSIEDNNPDQQPILLSISVTSLENNPSTIVLLSPIGIENINNFSKYIYMFYGNDTDQNVIEMHNLYELYKNSDNYQTKYWTLDCSKKWITR